MLTASRSLVRHSQSGKLLPKVEELHDLYDLGLRARAGQVIMISGRSGSGKSAFAMFWVLRMGLPCIYFSGDMSPYTASTRVAASITGETAQEIEQGMLDPERRDYYVRRLNEVPMQFSFGAPITWHRVEEEIDAYVELWDKFPDVIVVDNLKEMDGAESEYQAQMDAMAGLTDLARATGSTVMVLHHATDKGWDAKDHPFKPPARSEIKNGLSENPETSLSVAFNPDRKEFNVAIIKQREGWADPTAKTWATLGVDLARQAFYRKEAIA